MVISTIAPWSRQCLKLFILMIYISSMEVNAMDTLKGGRISSFSSIRWVLLGLYSSTLLSAASSCQLLGMNCATPTDFTFSFRGFCQRGGMTDVHAHGWGMAIYPPEGGAGCRVFHDAEAASTSHLATYLAQHSIQTCNMMGHIRFATMGKVNLGNIHPFVREMWGITWSFAHNGDVPLFHKDAAALAKSVALQESEDGTFNANDSDKDGEQQLPPKRTILTSLEPDQKEQIQYYHPLGTTDSEVAFCAILNALRSKFHTLPSLPVLYDALQQLCAEITSHDPNATIFNFLLTCGPHTQWVYSWPGRRPNSKVWNGLHYTTRQYPFSPARLRDVDYSVDFRTTNSPSDRVSVIATKPLTEDEAWIELRRGELLVFDQGRPYHTPYDLFQMELSGHGLHSTVLDKPPLEHDMRLYNFEPAHFQGQGI